MDRGSKYVEEVVKNAVNFSTPAYRLNEGLDFLVKTIKKYETFIKISE
jgi:hypothetical protein